MRREHHAGGRHGGPPVLPRQRGRAGVAGRAARGVPGRGSCGGARGAHGAPAAGPARRGTTRPARRGHPRGAGRPPAGEPTTAHSRNGRPIPGGVRASPGTSGTGARWARAGTAAERAHVVLRVCAGVGGGGARVLRRGGGAAGGGGLLQAVLRRGGRRCAGGGRRGHAHCQGPLRQHAPAPRMLGAGDCTQRRCEAPLCLAGLASFMEWLWPPCVPPWCRPLWS